MLTGQSETNKVCHRNRNRFDTQKLRMFNRVFFFLSGNIRTGTDGGAGRESRIERNDTRRTGSIIVTVFCFVC
jgi:hypothetical protein